MWMRIGKALERQNKCRDARDRSVDEGRFRGGWGASEWLRLDPRRAAPSARREARRVLDLARRLTDDDDEGEGR